MLVLPPIPLCRLDSRGVLRSRADWIRIRERPAFCRSGTLSSETLLCVRVNPVLLEVGEGGPEESAEAGKAGVMVKSSAARPDLADQFF